MSPVACEDVRSLIPDHAARRLRPELQAAVSEHVAGCAACASELELARLLFSARADAPPGLADRIVGALRRQREAGRAPEAHGPPARGRPATPWRWRARSAPAAGYRPWWGVAAAGLAAMAVGIGLRASADPSAGVVVPVYAREFEEGGPWISDDGLLAGAPALEGLSEEALRRLLEELSDNGGAA